jgi:FkbM family methyltransferase
LIANRFDSTNEKDPVMPMGLERSEQLEIALSRMENESIDAARTRESGKFEEFAAPFGKTLVLFGAGPLGKNTLAGLRRAGVEPLAFADNNPQLWGKDVDGLKVLPPDEVCSRYGDSACFVVTIYNGSAVRRQLAASGCKRVAPFPALFWKYPQIFTHTTGIDLPHRLHNAAAEIRLCDSILCDEASRRELREQLVWRYWLDYDALPPPSDGKHTYFPPDLATPRNDEVFVDCGSFDGDSLSSFATHWNGRFRHAFAFEADPANRAALASNIDKMGLAERTTIMPYAVGNLTGPVSFACNGTAGSHVSSSGGASTVEARKLDDVQWPFPPTYIKMDIESAEPEALIGAQQLLRRYHPILAICTYHRSEHLWQIPNLIHSISTDYRIFIRRYAEECWEGVCYAIPSQPLKKA